MGGRLRRLASGASRRVGIAVAALALAACASAPGGGVTHVVRPGENLYRISRYYGVSSQRVIEANHIRDVTELAIGRPLWIPGARRPQPGASLVPPAGVQPDSRALARRESDLSFGWPVRGRLSSRFGRRRGRPHEGIDISARRGTTIRAAEAGRVIHSGGGLGAYGNVVIIKHSGRYSTVYAHNRKNLVRQGEFVEKGDVIGEVGATGNASGPHVHFEIRRDRRAQDPLGYLQ